eukprot:s3157_g4.t1
MPESLPAEMSAFIWHEKESRRTAHQRRKQEREVKAQQTQAFLSNVTSGVEPPPFDLVLDQSERRLRVPSSCMGMVIGKKGEHVKSIEKDFKVTVKIEKDDASSDSILLVSGSSAAEVAAAVKALDFDSKILEVPKEIAGWVCGKAGRHLKLIREMTGVAVLSMKDSAEASEAQGEAHGDGTNPSRCSLEIKGLRENVEDAAMCMEAHMSYHSVFQEMEQVEKELDQRIADARGRLSRRAVPAGPSRTGTWTGTQGSQARSAPAFGGAKGRSKSPGKRQPKGGAEPSPAHAAKQVRTGRIWAGGAAEGSAANPVRAARGRGRGRGYFSSAIGAKQ